MQSGVFFYSIELMKDSILESFANSTLWVMMYQRVIVTYIGSLIRTVLESLTHWGGNRMKAIFLDFYGTVVHEDDDILPVIYEQISIRSLCAGI
ncbi:hypothetical protein CHI14_15695 [Paenibacillus sp. 7516]|nr:hypothetical protein CHI14_15695 [Paenibacillus sp. 7516]